MLKSGWCMVFKRVLNKKIFLKNVMEYVIYLLYVYFIIFNKFVWEMK